MQKTLTNVKKTSKTLKAKKALKTEILSNSSTGIKLLKSEKFKLSSLHRKGSFPSKIFSVNVTKSTRYYGFGHIY